MTAPLRILLVEDQLLNRQLIHAVFSRTTEPRVRTAAVTDAHDLTQARAAVAETEFHVILLDVQLPDGSGLALLDDLAVAQHRPAVIALTGGVLAHQRSAALAAGCDAILEKPFLSADLTSMIMNFVPESAG